MKIVKESTEVLSELKEAIDYYSTSILTMDKACKLLKDVELWTLDALSKIGENYNIGLVSPNEYFNQLQEVLLIKADLCDKIYKIYSDDEIHHHQLKGAYILFTLYKDGGII
jgi:hypothetical protein